MRHREDFRETTIVYEKLINKQQKQQLDYAGKIPNSLSGFFILFYILLFKL